jgi:hypothetical protein
VQGIYDGVTNSKICYHFIISFIISFISIILILLVLVVAPEINFQSIKVNIVVIKLCIVKGLPDFLNKGTHRCWQNYFDEVACTKVNSVLHAPWKSFVRKLNYHTINEIT